MRCEVAADLVGGCGAAGLSSAGLVSALGRVRNPRVAGGWLGSGRVLFDWELGGELREGWLERGVRFVGMIDGEGSVGVEPGEAWDVEPRGPAVELAILPVRVAEGGLGFGQRTPVLVADLCGNRLLVAWRGVDGGAELVRGWRVYLGGEAAADVDLMEVRLVDEGLSAAGLDVGPTGIVWRAGATGGRLRVTGDWGGESLNEVLTLELTEAAETGSALGPRWELRRASGGEVLATGEVVEGVPQVVDGGLRLEWLDGPEAYGVGDAWGIEVGPRRWWLSGELEAGSYAVEVAALDGAGNEGERVAAGAEVTVPVVPLAPEGVEAEVVAGGEGEGPTVRLTWTDGANCEGAWVSHNWDGVGQEFVDHVMDEGWDFVAAGDQEWELELPEGAAGEFLGYVRGVRESGEPWVEQNWNLVRLAVGMEGADLAAPEIGSVVAVEGGRLLVAWSLLVEGGEPEELRLYVATEEPAGAGGGALSQVVAYPGDVGFPVASGVFVTEADWEGLVWLELVAVFDGMESGRRGWFGPVEALAGSVGDSEGVWGWRT